MMPYTLTKQGIIISVTPIILKRNQSRMSKLMPWRMKLKCIMVCM